MEMGVPRPQATEQSIQRTAGCWQWPGLQEGWGCGGPRGLSWPAREGGEMEAWGGGQNCSRVLGSGPGRGATRKSEFVFCPVGGGQGCGRGAWMSGVLLSGEQPWAHPAVLETAVTRLGAPLSREVQAERRLGGRVAEASHPGGRGC